jgi:rhodanese-related sulfurtransferase
MFDKVPELSVADVRRLIEKGLRPKFIDARDPAARSVAATIPGAIPVPLERAREHVGALPRDRRLITYGSGDDDSRAAALARVLADRGFTAAYLRGGVAAWLEAGLPV